ncbi:MAG TPA: glycosyltransferase [Methylomirabilota bacterium]|nr:glycosyltransferase [Methylomirabilota bacterium]
MKQALFVHYFFLPVHNVAVKQLVGYARHLAASNWQTLVLTHGWHSIDEADRSWGLSWEPEQERTGKCTVFRVSEPPRARRDRATARVAAGPSVPAVAWRRHAAKTVAKMRRLRAMLFEPYPDEFIGWAGPAVDEGVRIAQRQRIDVIMSYCPPVTNHVVGHRLARRLGIPWVAFFGDLYGFLQPPLPRLSIEGFLKRAWHRRCLSPAAACVGVSPAMVDYLARTYARRTELIHTGFDPEDGDRRPTTTAPRDRLVVSHIGSVYPDDQRPELVFDGLDRLLARHPEVIPRLSVRFVGSKCEDRLRAMLAHRPAARVCSIEPGVDSVTAMGLVRDSDVLLALTCSLYRDRHGTLSYPTKIFDAFGTAKPVLAVPSDGDWVDALLSQTGVGTTADDAEAVAARLWDWFSCWSRDGAVPYRGRPEAIAPFTRACQAARLAALFDAVSGG